MTVREYLMRAQALEAQIDAHVMQLAHLRAMRERWKRGLQGTGGGADAEAQLRQLEDGLYADILRWAKERRAVAALIDAVPQENLRLLLEYRYLCGWDCRRIAAKMNYSLDRIWHLHTDALQALEQVRRTADAG